MYILTDEQLPNIRIHYMVWRAVKSKSKVPFHPKYDPVPIALRPHNSSQLLTTPPIPHLSIHS
ncbi:hypothetical protein CY34DRAFT_814387 [Suillus luteus UH-Slu-Lm8-n1]|uniref:Uncharacterized protein n=1 Tax=Suillus luteus UH-Slu-Lm8-n1 TaxID=930992 RepID=A0A0D0AD90_9AGAM|nr:hypothetical protein CY34DRAFT_814387 [Suillus luteus UH-Slu-Lm8-n1]